MPLTTAHPSIVRIGAHLLLVDPTAPGDQRGTARDGLRRQAAARRRSERIVSFGGVGVVIAVVVLLRVLPDQTRRDAMAWLPDDLDPVVGFGFLLVALGAALILGLVLLVRATPRPDLGRVRTREVGPLPYLGIDVDDSADAGRLWRLVEAVDRFSELDDEALESDTRQEFEARLPALRRQYEEVLLLAQRAGARVDVERFAIASPEEFDEVDEAEGQ